MTKSIYGVMSQEEGAVPPQAAKVVRSTPLAAAEGSSSSSGVTIPLHVSAVPCITELAIIAQLRVVRLHGRMSPCLNKSVARRALVKYWLFDDPPLQFRIIIACGC